MSPRPLDLIARRLAAQHLARPSLAQPAALVRHMGAVQAQDLAAGMWAVASRTRSATREDVERAMQRGALVRTWPMRGTLHFVPPADARWMLDLLAPRALRRAAGRERELGITKGTLANARRTLTRALSGGGRLTRADAYATLEKARVSTRGQRGIHLLGHLAQEGTLVLGPREGKQPTFVLLDEWIPRSRTLPRAEALAEVARRYVASHGPATLADLAWWTGLAKKEARAALEGAGRALREDEEGTWRPARERRAREPSPTAHLLPAFDEYLVAYKDRSAATARLPEGARLGPAELLSPTLVVDGQVVGTWTRTQSARGVQVRVRTRVALAREEREALERAGERYARYLGEAVDITGASGPSAATR